MRQSLATFETTGTSVTTQSRYTAGRAFIALQPRRVGAATV